MTFAEVDRRYQELKTQFDTGELAAEEFDEALRALMLQDAQGRWWAKARESGHWYYYDAVAQQWSPATPPAVAPPPSSPSSSSSPPNIRAQPAWANASFTQPVAQSYANTPQSILQPELSPLLKVVFAFLSFFVPIVGIVFFFLYRNKPAPEDRAAAKLFLVLGVVAFATSCLCSFVLPLIFLPFS